MKGMKKDALRYEKYLSKGYSLPTNMLVFPILPKGQPQSTSTLFTTPFYFIFNNTGQGFLKFIFALRDFHGLTWYILLWLWWSLGFNIL